MYHAVSDTSNRDWGPWRYAVSPEAFVGQLEELIRSRPIVPYGDVASYVRRDTPIDDGAVAITFDDGYADFAEEVLFVLEEHELPATVFVSTALVEERQAPFEQRLMAGLDANEHVKIDLGGRAVEYELTSDAAIRTAYEEIRGDLKFASASRREAALAALGKPEAPNAQPLSPDELRRLSDHRLVTVASHGHEHRPLTARSSSGVVDDLERSRSFLADLLGEPPAHLSYPYGAHNPSVRRAAREVGFASAVTTAPRAVRPQDWGWPYRIPRVDAATRRVG